MSQDFTETPAAPARAETVSADEQLLKKLGYKQELARRMSGFSNFAISLSIICILAGGITSFQVGFCSVGGASIGLGWPLVCTFSLIVAATMAQVASAFPTAGGLYHWASILGGKGWGWTTAWFNLVGLLTVVAAVNSGTYDFIAGAFHLPQGSPVVKGIGVAAIIISHALFNHKGIRLTSRMIDLSGYLIFIVAAFLTIALLIYAPSHDFSRLMQFTNYSGIPAEAPVFPRTGNIIWLFALGFLLPAYTITGFDASAHTSEETVNASHNVPRGIVQSVLISSLFGWVMLIAIVLAVPNMDQAAGQGANAFYWIVEQVLPRPIRLLLLGGIALSQYFCGMAALTSTSRMAYAFARDGGLPFSSIVKEVHAISRSPVAAIWASALLGLAFVLFVPYTTIAAVCVIFLYISYVLPSVAGFLAHGRTWTVMGPWQLGRWYRPLAILAAAGCVFLIVIGMQPPNEQAIWIVGGVIALLVVSWFAFERKRFKGPPQIRT
jgi:amino acid transporter